MSAAYKLDLLTCTVADLASALREKKISVVELVNACLDQIEKHDQQGLSLNAMSDVISREKAIAEAKVLDDELAEGKARSPIHGIPCVAKDIMAVKGFSLTYGNIAFDKTPVDYDAPFVAQLREAGVIFLGKACLSDSGHHIGGLEGKYNVICTAAQPMLTDRRLAGWSSGQGQGLWPFNKTRVPPGSSTGSNVAVLAGYCPFALGSELFGSIFHPAIQSGTVGMRMTAGDWSGEMKGVDEMYGSGFLAKSASDVQLIYSVLKPDLRAESAPAPGKRALRELRLGFPEAAFLPVHLRELGPTGESFAKAAKADLDALFDRLIAAGCKIKRIPARPNGADEFKTNDDMTDQYYSALLRYGWDELLPTCERTKVNSSAEWLQFLEHHRHLGYMPLYKGDFKGCQLYRSVHDVPLFGSDEFRALRESFRARGVEPIDKLFADHQLDALIGPSEIYMTAACDAGGRPGGILPLKWFETPEVRGTGVCIVGKKGQDTELLDIMAAIEPFLPKYHPPQSVVDGHWPANTPDGPFTKW